MKRREFLRSSSLALGLVPMVNANSFALKTSKEVGLQLFTLRSEISSLGIEKVLEEVAKLGYKTVETFGYSQGKFFGKSPIEFKGILEKNGLKALSGHFGTGKSTVRPSTDGVLLNTQKILDDSAQAGLKYVVVPSLGKDERDSSDKIKATTNGLSSAFETAKRNGITIGYHNHAFEFEEKIEGKKIYDILLENTPLAMEADLYWLIKAGENPVSYFEKYPGRFSLFHVKDMANTPEKEFAEVGKGSIDFASIFAKAKTAGLKHYFVEQDVCKTNPLECIKTSISTIKNAKWG